MSGKKDFSTDKHLVTSGFSKFSNRKKTWRKPYKGGKRTKSRLYRYEPVGSCRPHGGCPYCESNRMHGLEKKELSVKEQLEEHCLDPDGADAFLEAELWPCYDDDPMTPQEYVDPAYHEAWEKYKEEEGLRIVERNEQDIIDRYYGGCKEAADANEILDYLSFYVQCVFSKWTR